MPEIFDAHSDTVFELCEQNQELFKNSLHLDISRMRNFDKYIQVFAAFVDKTDIKCSPMNHCVRLLEKIHREIEKNGGYMELIEDAETLEAVRKNDKSGAILAIEGGEALEGNLSALWMFYKLGVRLITLTWNHANELADGITESRGGGLTGFGRDAVAAMEDMGILIDVSHLSVKGFWDVAECTKYPFTASHSCVKSLCGHIRNLDDDQISLMIKRDCVIGVNFYPEFLAEGTECIINDIVKHIEYIVKMGGENNVGLGSDFDGVPVLPKGMTGIQDMSVLAETIRNGGFSAKQTNKILFENFYRLFYQTMSRKREKL